MPVVTVVVVYFALVTIEIQVPSVIDIFTIQRARPIVAVVANIVDIAIVGVTSSKNEQSQSGHS